MKTWYRICNNAKMSSGQWLAQYALKDFENALAMAENMSKSEGVAPLMEVVTEADLQDNSTHQQIMHLTHSQDSRNFYKKAGGSKFYWRLVTQPSSERQQQVRHHGYWRKLRNVLHMQKRGRLVTHKSFRH